MNYNVAGFPAGCTLFRGPHSVECLTTLWRNGGCIDSGEGYPLNLTSSQYNNYNRLDIS